MNDDARCGSKPARWRRRVFFTKEWVLHEIPEEPARRGSHTSASLCLDGPTEKYGCIVENALFGYNSTVKMNSNDIFLSDNIVQN
jgi:hypothetical protein